MRMQIRTLQVPQRGYGAFCPTLTPTPTGATNGDIAQDMVGMPGTVAVPSPRPPAMADGELGGPYNQPSAVAPNVFYPSIYFNRLNRARKFFGAVMSGVNPLPAPARDPGRVAQPWNYKVRVGGQTATSNPRPFTRFPTYNGKGY